MGEWTPTGLLSVVVRPKTTADQERLEHGLRTLLAEDARLTAKPGPAPGEVVLAGVGELHLEIALDRLRREFSVEAAVGPPQIAYKMARRANPVLLEPVMRVAVTAPGDYADDIVAGLSSRRGEIQSREERRGMQVITAHVPLSDMLGYAVDLRDRTFGRASFAMQFARYQPVEPPAGGEHHSTVGVPRRPSPPSRQSGVALPEPFESDPEE
jgi:translation elongation factor EF-G